MFEKSEIIAILVFLAVAFAIHVVLHLTVHLNIMQKTARLEIVQNAVTGPAL